jgi:hypothetical protein
MVRRKETMAEPRNGTQSERSGKAENWVQEIRNQERRLHAIAAGYNKLNTEDPFIVFNWLNRFQVDKLPGQLVEERNRLMEELHREIESLVLGFDGNFREACHSHNWRVDGQWPSYYVQYFVRVEVSPHDRFIKTGYRQLNTLHMPEVVASIEEVLTSTAFDRIDVDGFISDLTLAYDQIVSVDHRQPSIWQLYKQFLIVHQRPGFWRSGRASLFRSYDEQAFRAAFTKMMQKDRVVTRDGRELRLFPPIKAEDGMFLFHPIEGRHGFVGRIELVSMSREAL